MGDLQMDSSIFDLLIAPWKTAILQTAVRLKVFSALADRAMSTEALASKVNAHEYSLEALLNALVGMDLLQCRNGKYSNTQKSHIYFRDPSPYYVGDFVELVDHERERWCELFSMISRDDPKPAGPKEKQETFIKGMNNLGRLGEVEALLNAVDLTDCRELIDAGGGSGIYSSAFCRKYPDLKSTLLDRAETLDVTSELLADQVKNERIHLKVCDIMKQELGREIDAVLLSDVVYDESDASKVLQNIWKCLKVGGQLIVRGYYADPDHYNTPFAALFTVNILKFIPENRIIDFNTLKSKIQETGFEIINSGPLTERSLIIVARKV